MSCHLCHQKVAPSGDRNSILRLEKQFADSVFCSANMQKIVCIFSETKKIKPKPNTNHLTSNLSSTNSLQFFSSSWFKMDSLFCLRRLRRETSSVTICSSGEIPNFSLKI